MKNLLGLILIAISLNAVADDTRLNRNSTAYRMMHALDYVEQLFFVDYAMHEWKAKHAQWQLSAEVDKVRKQLESGEIRSVKEFHRALRDLINSTGDYHVSVRFHATEAARLPLDIRSAEGKFFIAWIDRKKLSRVAFPFAIGDEVVQFGGRPTAEVVEELKSVDGFGNQSAAQRLAELRLTSRQASRAMSVPKGPVVLQIYSQSRKKLFSHQVIWDYREEKIILEPKSSLDGLNAEVQAPRPSLQKLFDRSMFAPQFEKGGDKVASKTKGQEKPAVSPWKIGGRSSFLPDLGTVVWRSSGDKPFDAYMFLNRQRQLIGYVRIATYSIEETDKYVEHFIELIKEFEKKTAALVIDQVNNPGGSVFYLYTLASLLTNQALFTPLHRMTVTQKDVAEALEYLPKLKKVRDDKGAQKLIGKTSSGYPVNYQFAKMAEHYMRFLINAWNDGQTLTPPGHIWGVDRINPHPQTRYTKPILLLTNGLDFSGGDFFPAIMQDNKRATIMGTNTAGAGGYVHSATFSNLLGIEKFSLTASYAERVDKNPIENLGVQPDIEYSLSANDFKKNYQEYKAAILKALETLAPVQKEVEKKKAVEEEEADLSQELAGA